MRRMRQTQGPRRQVVNRKEIVTVLGGAGSKGEEVRLEKVLRQRSSFAPRHSRQRSLLFQRFACGCDLCLLRFWMLPRANL